MLVAASSTFLCWNVNRKPLQHLVAELARSRDVEVVILLECDIEPGDVVYSLNQGAGRTFHYAASPAAVANETVRIFTRFSPDLLRPLQDGQRFTIREMRLGGHTEVLVAAVHFPSKLHWNNDSQAFECVALARAIAEAEKIAGHDRTILVGDLNMNPFESGVVGAAGLNATMVRSRASRQFCTVQGQDYQFFYNPMWGHFGEHDRKPPGTYYRDSNQHVNYCWNIFDQVLIRPSLLDMLAPDGVEIVTHAGRFPLLTPRGLPDRARGSDHLPLLFRLGF
jgi:endonuclease/exonuclease/phosphatase (EEP) superfamily protein YafD